MTTVILALLIGLGIAGWEAIDWRRKAEQLNDENLSLAAELEGHRSCRITVQPASEFGQILTAIQGVGDPVAGKAYLVGEKGPELFVPDPREPGDLS